MQLSELNIDGIQILTNGMFESLGLVTHDATKQLVYIDHPKYFHFILEKTNITCVITTKELAASVPEKLGIAISPNPSRSFYEIHNFLAHETEFYGKKYDAIVADDAEISSTAYVADKNVRIGKRCFIGPHASILENSILEDNVIVRAGTIIGTEGFQFKRFGNQILPIIHAGGVILHRNVEIQANSCIAKSVFGDFTEIGEHTKLDNLIHIGHNVRIGKRCLVAASAMIGGSAKIGDDVWIGPSATISSEVEIGSGACITLGSVVTKNIAPGQRVSGNFAIDHNKFIEFIKTIR